MSSKTSLLTRRLYRNLLRTSSPFTTPSQNASVLVSLLHRTGIDDHIRDWDAFVAQDLEGSGGPSGDTGRGDNAEEKMASIDRARDLSRSYAPGPNNGQDSSPAKSRKKPPSNRTYQRLFRRLLREVVTGNDGYGKMVFPSQADATRLRKVIQREFRANINNCNTSNNSNGKDDEDTETDATTPTTATETNQNKRYQHSTTPAASIHFDDETRRQVAFGALRELNKKLSYYDWLEQHSPKPQLPQQAARHVSALSTHPPASYLRPGVFLVSHPYMQDSYFSKTVICILEHNRLGNGGTRAENSDEAIDTDTAAGDRPTKKSTPRRSATPPGQTYGVIVNRLSTHNDTGTNRTLREVFREHMLPGPMADVFGDSVVREGGPVHVALQMVHSLSGQRRDELAPVIGGTVVPSVDDGDGDDEGRTACSDRSTYFQGNMFKVMTQVEEGKMNGEDISFFVGASIWSPGQLAAEIAQGYWIPCRGPPEMALDGICEHEQQATDSSSGNKTRPLADLWLSMMSACGEDEARLSHLFHPDHWDENGMACDAFDDEDDDIVVF